MINTQSPLKKPEGPAPLPSLILRLSTFKFTLISPHKILTAPLAATVYHILVVSANSEGKKVELKTGMKKVWLMPLTINLSQSAPAQCQEGLDN